MADPKTQSIVMLGATGAVGGEVVKTLLARGHLARLTLLGRRDVPGLSAPIVTQDRVDIFDPDSYAGLLGGHDTANCTLGVGQPTKTSKEDFLATDRDAVLNFAKACKAAGVRHFCLLGSVGASSSSPSFFLRGKGELEDGLRALEFDGLSLFRPCMILTPTNRYGLSQAITLAVWPALSTVLIGPLQKFRGIKVAQLGAAIANRALIHKSGVDVLEWPAIRRLANLD
jgi:uncharacterized protein YbjT (DUF2867 family)